EGLGAIATGWVRRTFVDPEFTFTFIGFEWLQPLPGNGMYFYFVLMAVTGVFIALGYYYRVAAFTFAIMWTSVYLMQKSHYNNHYYLMVLLGWIMFALPAHRRFSLDVKYGRIPKSETCPRICIKLFVVEVALVYIVASLNKIYPDWMAAEPIALWFGMKRALPVIGEYLQPEWLHRFIAYGGILYDGLIIPLLLFRQTRKIGLFLSIFFNLFNSIVFQIGIFPYLMIAFSLFFYAPEQISRFFFRKRIPAKEKVFKGSPVTRKIAYYGFIFFMVFQVFLSVRHHLFYGNVHWTEEGHRMAWQMMLRAKSGYGKFYVVDNRTGEREEIRLRDKMSTKQAKKLAYQPDMIWQFSRRLEKEYREKGWNDFSVYYEGKVRLNKGEYGNLIDPEVDLLTVKWERFSHSEWITPFPPERKANN
ncbi:MAG: HTTM domain-containing protein, partial [Cyclobacteriaceae bacterium]